MNRKWWLSWSVGFVCLVVAWIIQLIEFRQLDYVEYQPTILFGNIVFGFLISIYGVGLPLFAQTGVVL